MKSYIYIDYENKSDLNNLQLIENSRYFVFLGQNQLDKIKSTSGSRVKKIRCEKEGKNFLDCKLIDFLLKRRNVKDTIHYIVSKDKGYDSWVEYINKTTVSTTTKRIESLEEISNQK